MRPEALDAAIERDRAEGIEPLAVVAALGATGSTAIDPIGPIGEICARRGVWLHVDAAFAGVATLLPECRWMIEGIEAADSYVVNPHKWLLTNFDCTAYYVRDPEALIRTFEILPEYLKGDAGRRVNDYRDWGIPLGRRFRALKLWFVMRTYGAEGLRAHLRNGIQLAEWLEGEIAASKDFEPLVPRSLSHLCFRHHPGGVDDLNALNDWNARLLERLNATGRIYLTHTKLAGAYAIRLVVGQRLTTERHAREAWELIQKTAKEMK
jgi:aromatic-L-amino-acid decarboxylase